jgi:hypothetical protein
MNKRIILNVLLVLVLGVYFVYRNLPANNLSSQKSTANSVGITSIQAVQLVSNLPEVKTFMSATKKGVVSVDTGNGTDIYWLVHVFESFTDHNATFHWYSVDKKTGIIEKQI